MKDLPDMHDKKIIMHIGQILHIIHSLRERGNPKSGLKHFLSRSMTIDQF